MSTFLLSFAGGFALLWLSIGIGVALAYDISAEVSIAILEFTREHGHLPMRSSVWMVVLVEIVNWPRRFLAMAKP